MMLDAKGCAALILVSAAVLAILALAVRGLFA